MPIVNVQMLILVSVILSEPLTTTCNFLELLKKQGIRPKNKMPIRNLVLLMKEFLTLNKPYSGTSNILV